MECWYLSLLRGLSRRSTSWELMACQGKAFNLPSLYDALLECCNNMYACDD
jgi:MFS family permease